MSHKHFAPLLCLITLAMPLTAGADIYKHVDENGRVTYSNVPMRGAKKLETKPVPSIASPPLKPRQAVAPAASPSNFPRVDGETQKKRDDLRRKILQEELDAEQKLLGESRRELSEGEAVRMGDEARNYQKYLDRVQKLKDNVTLHEKNIEALRKELAALR